MDDIQAEHLKIGMGKVGAPDVPSVICITDDVAGASGFLSSVLNMAPVPLTQGIYRYSKDFNAVMLISSGLAIGVPEGTYPVITTASVPPDSIPFTVAGEMYFFYAPNRHAMVLKEIL